MRILFTAVMLLLSIKAHSGNLKKENPDVLPLWVFVTKGCPFDSATLRSDVEGVLIRSRIKPIGWLDEGGNNFHLSVSLSCHPMSNSNPLFSLDVGVSGEVVFNGETAYYTSRDNGTFGMADSDSIRFEVKRRVEAWITDYLKANFDL
jgi:hypothetical protein